MIKGSKATKEAIEKNRSSHLGQVAWNKGKRYSEEEKKKIKKYKTRIDKGRPRPPFSEEWKKHISEGRKGWRPTEDQKRNIAQARMGNKSTLGRKGEMANNWRGGITPDRLNYKYAEWRKAILTRDNFTCQKYGTRGGNLVAHHINSFKEFPELRFDINNGILLSRDAHLEFHSEYGYRNNTREQLEEFLNNY